MRLLPLTFALGLSAISAPAIAHEFWIDPEKFVLRPGETLRAAIRVGQEFEGSSYAYVPANFRRFDLVTGDAAEPAPVQMRLGDRPALSVPVEEPGLVTILHVTRDYPLTWDSWEKFTDFIAHKDAGWVLDAHDERGLPREAGTKEGYSRHAKSLVAVGEGAGADRAHGLETEIVARENPYTGETSDGLDVQVLYQDTPRADAQIEVFERAPDGVVAIFTVQTDGDGLATVPVTAGHVYLLDAVMVREPSAALLDRMEADWETLWASLTFAVPD